MAIRKRISMKPWPSTPSNVVRCAAYETFMSSWGETWPVIICISYIAEPLIG